MRPLIYLASPYTDPDKWREISRLCATRLMAAAMMLEGHTVFCPVLHGRQIELEAKPWIEEDQHAFWMHHDEGYLAACSVLVVLKLDGWQISRGVIHETGVAIQRGIPIQFLDPQRNIHEARAYIRNNYPAKSPAPGVRPGTDAEADRLDPHARAVPPAGSPGGEPPPAGGGGTEAPSN